MHRLLRRGVAHLHHARVLLSRQPHSFSVATHEAGRTRVDRDADFLSDNRPVSGHATPHRARNHALTPRRVLLSCCWLSARQGSWSIRRGGLGPSFIEYSICMYLSHACLVRAALLLLLLLLTLLLTARRGSRGRGRGRRWKECMRHNTHTVAVKKSACARGVWRAQGSTSTVAVAAAEEERRRLRRGKCERAQMSASAGGRTTRGTCTHT
jgi:hypothetical protein